MSFERYRAQLRFEGWPYWQQKKLAGLILDDIQARDLANDLRYDAADLYFKGALSACEAINSVSKKHFSWATVKLYYSVFYFLRATLAAKQIAILKHNSYVYVKAFPGETFHKSGSTSGSTHDSVLRIATLILRGFDLLLSNSIDAENPYFWLKEKRERISYRERHFHEPDVADFWQEIDQAKDLRLLINMYLSDTQLIYCFQEEHACLALPLKRWILTRNDLINAGISPALSERQIRAMSSFLRIDGNESLFSLLPDYDYRYLGDE